MLEIIDNKTAEKSPVRIKDTDRPRTPLPQKPSITALEKLKDKIRKSQHLVA
jgi:hypothetical protein